MNEARIPLAAIKGRGTATRFPHRFESDQRHDFDDGLSTLLDEVEARFGLVAHQPFDGLFGRLFLGVGQNYA